MTDTIPDHVGREAVRLLNEDIEYKLYAWPGHSEYKQVITVAKLLMNPPAPMTDPDEEAARRLARAIYPQLALTPGELARATDQMRKEREAWGAGR